MGKAKFWPLGLRNPWTDFDETWNIYPSCGYAHRCKSMWRCDNVGGLGEHVKKHLLWFLRYTFLKLFEFLIFLLYSSARAEHAHVDRFWRPIRHTTCFRPRMCLLWVSLILLPILGLKAPKNPYFGAWICILKLNMQNIKSCILPKLLHRLQPNFAQSQRPPNTLRVWSQHA